MRSTRDPGGNAGQRRAQARAAKSPRWSAERRAFPSLETLGVESTAPPSRSWHALPGARSTPAPVGAPPSPHRGGKQKKRKANRKEGRKEEKERRKEKERVFVRGAAQ